MQIVNVPVDSVIPYDSNPRNNQNAVQYVANSISEFGFKVPIILDANNVIVAGHTRYLAAKSLGLETVPAIIADDLTEEQVKAFRIADNKTAEQSDWNLLKLSKEIIGIDFDLEDFGFSDIEIDNLESLGNDFFGTSEADEADIAPNMYAPNVFPRESNVTVTGQQVERAKERLENRFSSQMVSEHRKIICPHCGEEFEID